MTVSVLCPRAQPRSALPHEARDTVRGGVRTEERRGEECLWAGMRVTEASVSCRTMRQDGVQSSRGYETASSLNRNLFCRCYRCFTVSLFYISTWTPCARTHHNLLIRFGPLKSPPYFRRPLLSSSVQSQVQVKSLSQDEPG